MESQWVFRENTGSFGTGWLLEAWLTSLINFALALQFKKKPLTHLHTIPSSGNTQRNVAYSSTTNSQPFLHPTVGIPSRNSSSAVQ